MKTKSLYPMYIVDNTTSTNHYFVIKKLASSSDELILISPFCFADFHSFIDELANHGSIKSITFMTTLKPEEITDKVKSFFSFRQSIEQYGIQGRILINNFLHGKVYIFKSCGHSAYALVTSANVTFNGLNRNHEWGCCFDDKNEIDNLEKNIIQTTEYELSNKMLDEIKHRVDLCKKTDQPAKEATIHTINISDIIVSNKYGCNITPDTRIFLKPIGHTKDPVYDGDYSGESEQFFARQPIAVRKNDVLIAYGVGSRKIIAIFRVISDTHHNTGNKNDRWPWYVDVENMTPKFSRIWFDKDLYITKIAQNYVDDYDSYITNNKGKTLGALQWGADKIRLAYDFGMEVLFKIMSIEQKL